MIARTIATFAAHPGVDEILVVIHPMRRSTGRQPLRGLRKAVPGGRRQDSVRARLEALASEAPHPS
jgi:2-C-methyl-D-erythritol 4-phosphate cytidylyltransferase/2-C-methyl-D-erythritol 2,4-cyclodiphosphate synthase